MLGIGRIITVEEQSQFTDYKALGNFLRKSVYDMEKPEMFITRNEFKMSSNHTELNDVGLTL